MFISMHSFGGCPHTIIGAGGMFAYAHRVLTPSSIPGGHAQFWCPTRLSTLHRKSFNVHSCCWQKGCRKHRTGQSTSAPPVPPPPPALQ